MCVVCAEHTYHKPTSKILFSSLCTCFTVYKKSTLHFSQYVQLNKNKDRRRTRKKWNNVNQMKLKERCNSGDDKTRPGAVFTVCVFEQKEQHQQKQRNQKRLLCVLLMQTCHFARKKGIFAGYLKNKNNFQKESEIK